MSEAKHEQHGDESVQALRDLVHAHRVRYEVLSEEWAGRERLKIGFELKLWGAHVHGAAALSSR